MLKVSLTPAHSESLNWHFLWDHVESFITPSSLISIPLQVIKEKMSLWVKSATFMFLGQTEDASEETTTTLWQVRGWFLIHFSCSEVVTAQIWAWSRRFNLSCPFVSAAQIPAKTEIGNVSNVSVGHNTGSIGSGNRFNISWGKKRGRWQIYWTHRTHFESVTVHMTCLCINTLCQCISGLEKSFLTVFVSYILLSLLPFSISSSLLGNQPDTNHIIIIINVNQIR